MKFLETEDGRFISAEKLLELGVEVENGTWYIRAVLEGRREYALAPGSYDTFEAAEKFLTSLLDQLL